MYWETLPWLVWIIYYSFLGVTFLTAIIRIGRKKSFILEIFVIVSVIALPAVGFLFSADAGRPLDQNEIEFFVSQLKQGKMWSVFSVAGYGMIVIWWIMLVFEKRTDSL